MLRCFLLGAGIWLLSCASLGAQEPVAWSDTLLAIRYIEAARRMNQDDRHAEALEKAGQALDIYTRLYGEDHVRTARARLYVAREYRVMYREEEAVALIQKSRTTFEAAGDTVMVTTCYNLLSLCLREQFRFAEAREIIQTAIHLLKTDSAANASVLAKLYVTIGTLLYSSEKNYLAAIPVFEQARQAFATLKDYRSEGEVCFHLGGAYFGLHDYARAREHYLIALAVLKGRLPPEHSYFPDLYVKIGLCCQKLGESEAGLRYMLAAEEPYLRQGSTHLNYISFQQRLGKYYLEEAQYETGLAYMTQSLNALEAHFGPRSYHLLRTIQDLGAAAFTAGRYELSEECIQRGLRIIRDSVPAGSLIAFPFHTQMAEIRLHQGDFTGCMAWCDSAAAVGGFSLAQSSGGYPQDYFRHWCSLYGRALKGQYPPTGVLEKLLEAERYFAAAAETLFQEVEEISINSSRELFYDRDHKTLEDWLEVQLTLYQKTGDPGYAEAAFRVVGRSKAFLLSMALRNSGALHFAGVPDSVLQTEMSLQNRIAAAEKSASAYSLTDSTSLRLHIALAQWRREYEDLLHRIDLQYPEYYRLRLLREEHSIQTIRESLHSDQAVLVFSAAGQHFWAFLLTTDTLCVVQLPLKDSINEDLDAFRRALTAFHSSDDPEDVLYDQQLVQYIRLGQALYTQFVEPVAALLPERVIILPEGKLHYLSFEALLGGIPGDIGNFRTYPFWALKKSISYAFSVELLNKSATSGLPSRINRKKWLGLAPFGRISNATDWALRYPQGNESLPILPYTYQEVQQIAHLMQGDARFAEEATLARFQREARDYDMLHLATHSRADDRQGDYSYLVLSPSGEKLPARDLYQMSLAADMVVLSACEAGGGKLINGEGIIGLVRAFTYAGARSVVASQWLAGDQSTAELMIEFYRQLQKGLPKDLALQAARLHLIRNFPAQAHPFYWAGFRFYGASR